MPGCFFLLSWGAEPGAHPPSLSPLAGISDEVAFPNTRVFPLFREDLIHKGAGEVRSQGT